MALILAVNPGGTQSGTLARVARELHDHELIGADSCAVAIDALDEHKPALVLLPAAAPVGEPELLSRLRTAVAGGIPTMRLPPPTSVNPRALADQIRQALKKEEPAAPDEPAGASLHMIAAAKTAISWIRARRASWATEPMVPAIETAPVQTAPVQTAPREDAPRVFEEEPAAEEMSEERETPAVVEPGESIAAAWLPRVAVIVAAALLIWAVISYW
ncbi:MAG TPA: hypothetical protein VL243_04850 [Vicinamibacterales bacterium]|jgi:hypothetical protein|nr:hypothetical protein [Vicinamibacterales bacterium]